MKTKKISHELAQRREALMTAYNDEDLHQLRITIRRLRGLLKRQTSPEAKRLKRQWSKLVKQTNQARDWDTFIPSCAPIIDKDDLAQLKPYIELQSKQAHQQVLSMLTSKLWDKSFSNWTLFYEKHGHDTYLRSQKKSPMAAAIEEVLRTAMKACHEDKEEQWHAFRIAIKNLRYVLDNSDLTQAVDETSLYSAQIVCRQLQEHLGQWHDTVIHRALLAQLNNGDALTDQPPQSLIDSLQQQLKSYGDAELQKIKNLIHHHLDSLKRLQNLLHTWT